MTQKTNNKIGLYTIAEIDEAMKTSPQYPFNLQSGWLPPHGSKSMEVFFTSILEAEPQPYAPCIEDLNQLIEENDVLTYLVNNACKENANIIDTTFKQFRNVPIPRIDSKETILNAFNAILKISPRFINDDLVGLPFSGFVVGIDPTLSGVVLFRLPMFNEKMSAILNVWNGFLDTEESNVGFRVEGEQWLSDKAKASYDFPIWKKDSETLPYWKSWNSFFTREFKNKDEARPIDNPDSNVVVNSANDGSLFRWRADISKNDVFWFKDMQYSLSDILSTSVEKDQATIDNYNLVEMFEGGSIFQTYLNPYNFHRWWAPVNGTVLFDPIVVPGCFFNKLVIPDYGGATTASLPYLAQVNARGIIVIQTQDYGNVCCIPLGMSEVSTISFNSQMVEGAEISKGDEMGSFNYGGSSFVLIFQKLPGKTISFENNKGTKYSMNPPLPSGSSSTGGEVTSIGSQIGKWIDL